MEAPPLFRSREDRVFAGVCAGLAFHLKLPVVAVRIAMGAFALLGGAGVVFYLWLWATVPEEGETEGVVPLRRALTRPAEWASAAVSERAAAKTPGAVGASGASGAGLSAGAAAKAGTASGAGTERVADSRGAGPVAADEGAGTRKKGDATGTRGHRKRWPIAEILLGICLLVAGAALVLAQFGLHIRLEVILPALAVLVGVGLTWWQIADRDRPDRNQVPRVLGALVLVAVGVLMFFVTARQPNAWTVIAAALAVLAGVALALAPWLLRINRELSAERAARAREAERAEIAAHLHDSVLQTLALIQQRSGPGSDLARLARAQERELREWLFRAADGVQPPPREALDVELKEHAAVLEEDHAVRFEVVVVGGQAGGSSGQVVGSAGLEAPEAIVLAAREAMLNAARHAGGEVTVYVEFAPESVQIDVTDRGPGIDVDALPEGRMGVRESILGRMERGGGTARIIAGPGGRGTAVRLAIPRGESATRATQTPTNGNERGTP